MKFWERLESETTLKPQVETRRLLMAERYSFSVYFGGITMLCTSERGHVESFSMKLGSWKTMLWKARSVQSIFLLIQY